MARYSVQILPTVIRKDLAKIPKTDVQKIMNRIKLLGHDPRPTWSKKLTGRKEYRARQGNYRILYIIEEEIKIVQVTKVGHRSSIDDCSTRNLLNSYTLERQWNRMDPGSSPG